MPERETGPAEGTGRGHYQRVLARAFLVVASVASTLTVLEIAARYWLLHRAGETSFLRYASLQQVAARRHSQVPVYTPHRYLGYFPTPHYARGDNRHNSLGYRGKEVAIPKPGGTYRIVCLGGSTTYTSRVKDHRLSYPALLEKRLHGEGLAHVEVVNAGAGGWSSWESLINLELRVLDLDPDLVIVYHGVNDVHPRLVWPPEAYRGDNSGHRIPSAAAWDMPSLLEHSTFARIVMVRGGRLAPPVSFQRTIDRAPETYVGDLFGEQMAAGGYPAGIFESVSAREMLEANPPRYLRRNIENIIAISQSRGIEVVLSSFAYSPLFRGQHRASSAEYVMAHEENNALLAEVAEHKGAFFYDFAAEFPTSERFFTDGRHVNKRGARLKANLFAAFLLTIERIPSPTSDR